MKRDLDSIILTRQELPIMKVIWEKKTATAKTVYSLISQKKTTAYTTILTIMEILEDKGVLTHTTSGRAFLFKPLLSKQQAIRNQIHDLITRFFDGNTEKLIEDLLEYEIHSPIQLDSIREFIDLRQESREAWQRSQKAPSLEISRSDIGLYR